MDTISIVKEVGSLAVSSAGGDRVAELAAEALSAGREVELDFAGVELASTTFLNHAIGSLFGRLDEDQLVGRLKYRAATQDVEQRIARVVGNARQYYSDTRYRDAVDRATEAVAAGGM